MKSNQVLRSILAALGVALAGIPVVWVLFSLPFTLLLSAAAGYGAGTLINRAGGRNGGPLAIALSVLATAIPFFVVLAPDLLAGGNVNPFSLIAPLIAAIAAAIANRRI
jgi:hypothetical protein